MVWFYLIVNLLVLVIAGLLGWRLRRLGSWGFAACMAGAGAVFAIRLFLHAHPEYEQYLLRLSDDYVYFATWEAPLVVLMTFGLAGRLRSRRVRLLVSTALVLVAPLFVWNSLAVCTVPAYAMPAQFDEAGVCRQQTDYSCGPASAVTLLKHLGQTVTEGEMATLCLSRPERGITILELCRGLNVALRTAGRQAVIERLTPAELGSLQPPFLAEVRRGRDPRVEHCVVVLRLERDSILLADPARGRCSETTTEFLGQWTGSVIVLR